jgi:hypothetical protein
LTLALAILHKACLPILVLIKELLNELGRYRSTSERGFREDVIASRDRVESGGRVDRDRKASEDAPIGYRIMKRLYLLISWVLAGKAWCRGMNNIDRMDWEAGKRPT